MAMIILVLIVILGNKLVGKIKASRIIHIQLEAANVTMIEGEERPELSVKVTYPEKKKDKVLSREKKYTVKDFAKDLEEGRGAVIQCEGDGQTEGSYPIKIKVDKSVKNKKWSKKIAYDVKNGTLTVQSKAGVWDGTKFKRHDGTYVTESFITSMGKSYYFDAEGEMVTGWQTINDHKYYFDDDGVMHADEWAELDGGKAYLSSSGSALVGWLDLDGDVYYFDGDCKMVTGKKKIGTLKCKFGKDGKMISRKNDAVDPDKPMIALTFDDGPGERTEEVLDALEKNGARATFFVQGKNIPGNEHAIERMKEIGCEIGNHSYDHPQLTAIGSAKIKEQLGSTNKLVMDIIGEPCTVLRPPYGAIDDTVRKQAGMPMILWNIDTLDWKSRNKAKIIETTLKYTDDGDIVLLHDIHTESVDATLELIPKLIADGNQLVTVTEMATARGITLENGESYTDFNK